MKYNVVLCLVGGLCLAAATQAATPAYRSVVLADSPIVYFEFDETSGTTAANSGSTGAANDGTIGTDGGAVTINQASFAGGGTAYNFDGGHVLAAALPSSLTEWTIAAWVNWDPAKTTASNIFGNDQGGWNDDVLFGIGAEGGSQGVPGGSVGLIHQGNPGTTRDFVGSPMSDSVWHHVVVTASTTNSELILYVDGVEVAKNEILNNGVTMNGGANGDPGTIGTPFLSVGAARAAVDPGFRSFDGLIDEFAIYGTVLGADAILAHYTAGTSPGLTEINITNIDYNRETDTVSITWTSEPGRTYGLFYSQDLTDWGTDVDDSIPSQGDTTVFEFPNPVSEANKIFFRVEKSAG
ncbi:MAG: LamG domain-containing protein, partial [Akkermansiaceae bacterium]|nr:LamG domain-containing protein [Akkermansiaceae bacterium]